MVFPPRLRVADGSFPVHLILPRKPGEIKQKRAKKGGFGRKRRRNRRFFAFSVPPRERQPNPVDLKTKVWLTFTFMGCSPRFTLNKRNNWNSCRRGFGAIGEPFDSVNNSGSAGSDSFAVNNRGRIHTFYGFNEIAFCYRAITTFQRPGFVTEIQVVCFQILFRD